jgi:hypothetical protein
MINELYANKLDIKNFIWNIKINKYLDIRALMQNLIAGDKTPDSFRIEKDMGDSLFSLSPMMGGIYNDLGNPKNNFSVTTPQKVAAEAFANAAEVEAKPSFEDKKLRRVLRLLT